ncbi:MAG TPA: glycosyltransferase family 2 protein [Candidatus Limnocylindria bacterium]|nr:glycosyltransferase family 2 protein [Candidatus Limnocylindria bacterium]
MPDVAGRRRASLVLPAYNEEAGVRATLAAVAAVDVDGLEIILVDDASTDATAHVALAAGAVVVRHALNRGKGAALRTGVAAARADRIVTMDADATYPATAIPRVLELLDDHDYVSAARREGRANIPLVNRLGNAAIATAIRLLSGSRLADPLTGMYGIRRSAFLELHPASDGFAIETEVAMKAAGRSLRTAQVWIEYGTREGQSKLRPIRDGIDIARTILAVALEARALRRRTAY